MLYLFSLDLLYSVYDFIDTLANSSHNPGLMYLEDSQRHPFYLNHNGTKIGKMGSYETEFNENDDDHELWRIPNSRGITKK